MTEHVIKIFDYRPLKSKNTKECIKCHAMGRDLVKYKTCEKYNQHNEEESKKVEEFMERQDKLRSTLRRK
jgi:hypothetical protein